jgi:hypothetical protein
LWCLKWQCHSFFSEFSGFSLSVSFHRSSIFIDVLFLPEEQTGEALETFLKTLLFRKSGSVRYQSTFNFFFFSYRWFNGLFTLPTECIYIFHDPRHNKQL